MFICECGREFEDNVDEARDHMLEQHLDLIETRFEDFLESDNFEEQNWTEEEIFDEAIEDVLDDMLDEIVEE